MVVSRGRFFPSFPHWPKHCLFSQRDTPLFLKTFQVPTLKRCVSFPAHLGKLPKVIGHPWNPESVLNVTWRWDQCGLLPPGVVTLLHRLQSALRLFLTLASLALSPHLRQILHLRDQQRRQARFKPYMKYASMSKVWEYLQNDESNSEVPTTTWLNPKSFKKYSLWYNFCIVGSIIKESYL